MEGFDFDDPASDDDDNHDAPEVDEAEQAQGWVVDRQSMPNQVVRSHRHVLLTMLQRHTINELLGILNFVFFYEEQEAEEDMADPTYELTRLVMDALREYMGEQFVTIDGSRQRNEIGIRTLANARANAPGQEFNRMYSFDSEDILRLAQFLELVDGEASEHSVGKLLRLENRSLVGGVTALLIYLRRMRLAEDQRDLGFAFDMPSVCISYVCRLMAERIGGAYGHLLHQSRLGDWRAHFPAWRTSIVRLYRKIRFGDPDADTPLPPEIMDTCMLVDGTMLETARPMPDEANTQAYMYNGCKKVHGLAYLALVAPNGIVVTMAGPYGGANNDLGIMNQAGLQDILQEACGNEFKVLGDGIFSNTGRLVRVPREAEMAGRSVAEVKAIASVRGDVEHAFCMLRNQFPYLNSPYLNKPNQTRPALHWQACVLLLNMHSCLYGNQITSRMDTEPPSLDEYLMG